MWGSRGCNCCGSGLCFFRGRNFYTVFFLDVEGGGVGLGFLIRLSSLRGCSFLNVFFGGSDGIDGFNHFKCGVHVATDECHSGGDLA